MTRWRYREGDEDDQDQFEKFGKMRSKSNASKSKKDDLTESFELEESKWPSIADGFVARVVEVHKRYAFVSPEKEIGKVTTTDVWLSRVARKYLTARRTERNFIVVGDRVLCRPAEEREREGDSDLPQCIVLHMAPRISKISRVDPIAAEREHVLASNVQQLLVVASFLAPKVKWGLIDRYLVLAEADRIKPILIFNKYDLLEAHDNPKFKEECLERAEYYRQLGYEVLIMQANLAGGPEKKVVERLQALLANKISMFSGHSGVGKSSIVNLFTPEIVQDVEPDSNIFYKGRHTTSYASFLRLKDIGYVIDTPGIRSFVIQERDVLELCYGFIEFREPMKHCAFGSCRHIDEPDCAVVKAVAEGKIAEWRYKNYSGILLGTTGREGRIREQQERLLRQEEVADVEDFDIEEIE